MTDMKQVVRWVLVAGIYINPVPLSASKAAFELEHGMEFRDCDSCPVMMVIPPGNFLMGSNGTDGEQRSDETPQHRVEIAKPFAIGKYEITRGQFAEFVNASGHDMAGGCIQRVDMASENNESHSWSYPGYEQNDRHPAVCVSWNDAQAYVSWLSKKKDGNYRLSSDSEWEYAARAGTRTERYWGDSANEGCQFANGADLSSETILPAGWNLAHCEDGYSYTAEVGSLLPNAFGLHDMLGNVAEWVADCWNGSYIDAPPDGSVWMDGDCTRPILRGASWHDDPRFLRSANRYGFQIDLTENKNARFSNFGFRVAKTMNY